jgi:hypothetical protein
MKTRFHNFRSSLIPASTIQDYTGPHLGCQASAFSAQELEITRASHGNAIVITLNGAAFADVRLRRLLAKNRLVLNKESGTA